MKRFILKLILTLICIAGTASIVRAAVLSFPLISPLENINHQYKIVGEFISLNNKEQKILRKTFVNILANQKIENFDELIILTSALMAKERQGISKDEKALRKTSAALEKLFNLDDFTKEYLKQFPWNLSHQAMNSLKFMAKYGSKGALIGLQAVLLYYALPAGQVLMTAKLTSLGTIITPAVLDKVIPGAIATMTTDLQSKIIKQLGGKIDDYLSNYLDAEQALPGARIPWRNFSYDPLELLFINLEKIKLYENLSTQFDSSFVKGQMLSTHLALELDLRAVIRQISGLTMNSEDEGLVLLVHMAKVLKDNETFNQLIIELENKNKIYKQENLIHANSIPEIQFFSDNYKLATKLLSENDQNVKVVASKIFRSIINEESFFVKHFDLAKMKCGELWGRIF